MPTQQEKKLQILAFLNPWQLIGCLAALGCALLFLIEQVSQTTEHYVVRTGLVGYAIASVVLALINFMSTKKYLVFAALPAVYVLAYQAVSLFGRYGQWYEAIFAGLPYIGATIVVLCAAAYRFDSQKTPFVLLVLMFGAKVLLTAIRNTGELGNFSFWATLLFFVSVATTTYVIAGEKNSGVPTKDISDPVVNQHDYNFSVEQIDLAKIIPHIDGDEIQSIANSIQHSDMDPLYHHTDEIRQGLYVIDSLAQKEERKGGFRSAVIGSWLGNRYSKFMKAQKSYKTLNRILWIVGVIAVFAIAIGLGMVGFDIGGLLNIGIVAAISFVPFLIIRGCV